MKADDTAARLAQAAAEHLCRAWAFDRQPITRKAARQERTAAATQLRMALEQLEQAA